ncbi:MAG: 16S rRNA (cytosine(1402)-N(4))-methyltransferase RsmH [Bacilli bacterium]|nr:16S rRNA (cytosine(1402)-N(4))-methyltransferase RsmH [Bacilli bacterium]
MKHLPVLKNEAIKLLDIKPNGIYLDFTIGRAGHASEILKRLGKDGLLIGFDLDEEAVSDSEKVLAGVKTRGHYEIIHSNYRYFDEFLRIKNIDKVDGILLDLGVSSPQLDEDYRGFSYQHKGNLDMRMDRSQKLTAKYIINNYSLRELTRIFRENGEDPDAYKIAKRIVKRREWHEIISTIELAEMIKHAKPKKNASHHGHPAQQVFQALRIEVNDELNNLEIALSKAVKYLKPDGRLVVISFHSLEDRIVKNIFEKLTRTIGDREDVYELPTNDKMPFVLLTKKVVTPSKEETETNSRAKSAKLRAIKKC